MVDPKVDKAGSRKTENCFSIPLSLTMGRNFVRMMLWFIKKPNPVCISVLEIGVGNKCITLCRPAIIHENRTSHHLDSEEGSGKQEEGLGPVFYWLVCLFFFKYEGKHGAKEGAEAGENGRGEEVLGLSKNVKHEGRSRETQSFQEKN